MMDRQIIRPVVCAEMLRANLTYYPEINLSAANNWIIMGNVGSGKSTLAKVMIYMISRFPNSKTFLCDAKYDDFRTLDGLTHYYPLDSYERGLSDFGVILENRLIGNDLNRSMCWIILEEWSAFLSSLPKSRRDAIMEKFIRYAMLSRSFNLHIMVILQRADARWFDSVRDNFSVIALSNLSREAAMMFGFDREAMRPVFGAGAGHMIINGNSGAQQEIVVPRVDMPQLDEAIKRYFMNQ